jgi:hypothetical protein
MTNIQEEALYEFLEGVTEPFDLEEIISFIRIHDARKVRRLSGETIAFLDARHFAFRVGDRQWISRRGCFEGVPFVISPTRLELQNGILIPGHRCVPFANPDPLPHEFSFFWQKSEIPVTDTQGAPDDFYPYYSIFGEEYAPQYVARDNVDNVIAFNNDPYDDPPEVTIHTLDMRNIYRESSFVPGDRFVARTLDWKRGIFSLEKIGKDEWDKADLASWLEAAEAGFADSFRRLGPGSSTEEQIAFAYWYGGSRMREVPAYSLEEFLYEKTDNISTTSYGIETRYWYAGREIPDRKGLDDGQTRPDRTDIEKLFWEKNIPISEFVIQSYVKDFLYRNEKDMSLLIDRLIPSNIALSDSELRRIEDYITGFYNDAHKVYSIFLDKETGPIRQRVAELHTAVIELSSRLSREDTDSSWLPKHTFIILSQIQIHAAGLMEDLAGDDLPFEIEIDEIENSLDSMVETYEEIRMRIESSLENSRRNKFSLVKPGVYPAKFGERLLQFSVGGTEIWRRVVVNENCRLFDLHQIIQVTFGWKNSQTYQFSAEKILEEGISVKELGEKGIVEILYEYGTKWTVKVMLLSRYETNEEKPVRCVAGAGAPPPELIGGPLRFSRFVSALEWGSETERHNAKKELGQDFNPGDFDLEACNRRLRASMLEKNNNRKGTNK